MRIQGSGAVATAVDAKGGSSVFVVDAANRDVEINHFSVRGGNEQYGGGIRIEAGKVEILRDAG